MALHGLYDDLGSLSLFGILMLCGVMYGFAVLILYPMRYAFEGVAYNVARSSNIGDLSLTVVVFSAWVLLHESGVRPPWWAVGFGWQMICALIGTIVALIFSFGQTSLARPHVADIYHNSVVMGVMVFALMYVAPLILWSGNWTAIFISLLALSVWVGFVISDTNNGRMQQRQWLAEHRPNLKFKD